LTHACELHCAHCYDRTLVSPLRLPAAKAIVDDMERFCGERGVAGNVCLSGGNPFLYKWFFELYEYVAAKGFRTSILGNPVDRQTLERLVAIQKPGYFQVSLEGLPDHNDRVRGAGFFERVMGFLPLLSELGIRRVVMVTLTRDNMDEIIPLSEVLRGKVDRMSFNRLSQVGEGASLGLPSTEAYGRFMVDYIAAARNNPALGFKDNLFNIFRHELGLPLYGGCTGFGCGAAFNFLAVLPNGDAHACRKFPSRLGNLHEASLGAIYDSADADRYRAGCAACDGCAVRHRCGGCLAVTQGQGGDPFVDRDPHCFM
jgi:selenobiotic family peptide radical SAM maturase